MACELCTKDADGTFPGWKVVEGIRWPCRVMCLTGKWYEFRGQSDDGEIIYGRQRFICPACRAHIDSPEDDVSDPTCETCRFALTHVTHGAGPAQTERWCLYLSKAEQPEPLRVEHGGFCGRHESPSRPPIHKGRCDVCAKDGECGSAVHTRREAANVDWARYTKEHDDRMGALLQEATVRDLRAMTPVRAPIRYPYCPDFKPKEPQCDES